jgi:hypothetical protein
MQVQEFRYGATELICKFKSSGTVQLKWYASSGVPTWCQRNDCSDSSNDLICKFRTRDTVPTNWYASSGVQTWCQWNDTPGQFWDTVPQKLHPISAVKCGANKMVFKLNAETTKIGVLGRLPLIKFTRCYLAILCHDFCFPYKMWGIFHITWKCKLYLTLWLTLLINSLISLLSCLHIVTQFRNKYINSVADNQS